MRLAFLFLLLPIIACTPKSEDSKEKWIQLFNGKNLVFDNLSGTWDEAIPLGNGLLKVSYDQYETFNGEFGHIFYNKPFSDYILRVEYRFVGEQVPNGPGWAFRNSGAMLHCQPPESMGQDQDFPVSIEAQFLGGNGTDPRPTANLCTPGTNVFMGDSLFTPHCVNSTSKTFHGDQWVTVDMIVHSAKDIHHVVEGDTVMSYSKPQVGGNNVPEGFKIPDGTLLGDGFISLQAESHAIEFRKVELLDLSQKK